MIGKQSQWPQPTKRTGGQASGKINIQENVGTLYSSDLLYSPLPRISHKAKARLSSYIVGIGIGCQLFIYLVQLMS